MSKPRCLLAALVAAAIVPALSASAAEPIALFDGTSLDAFYTFIKDRGRDDDPKGVFSMKDGELVITGEEWGCVTTKESFGDYHLVAEFRWAGPAHGDRKDKARDNGLLIHSQGEDGAYSGTWMYGIEVQIIEGGTGDFLVVADGRPEFALTAPVKDEQDSGCWVYDPEGHLETIHKGRINWWGRDPAWTDTIDYRGPQDVEKPVGEWNRLEVIALGRTVTVVLNGTLVNQAVDVLPREGRIQIQSEGAEIRYRKIELTPLATPEK
ncbi:MAG: DUF1080 domain-containing protein [Candidatus Hydrogenedens sp.]|nr:DUF1080 domain-containing protein [Candidatus Hydrogenedens sp.]